VVSGIGVDRDALLDGFAIVAGNAAHAQGAPFIGGGIYLDQANATIRNCTLHDNAADKGGGMVVRSGSPILSNLLIADNHAIYGGGMALAGNATISFVTFRHNSADYGGGLEIEGGNPQISEVFFSGNTASLYGGGMLAWRATPVIRQATFASNTAPHGGAIAIQETNLLIRNSIVWGNGSDPIYNYALSMVDVQYSIVEGIAAGFGNRNLDPLFINAMGADGIAGTADDDLHVQVGSPAIDAGNNGDIPADLSDSNSNGNTSEPILIDLDGHPRLANGMVDMGVYEATPTQATATTTPTTTPTDRPTPTPTNGATPTPVKPPILYPADQ
jgi:predicted outer membrane repeat protein